MIKREEDEMTLEIIKAPSLAELAQEAIMRCEKCTIHNLVLHGEISIEEIDCEFVKANTALAKKWQATTPSRDLYMTHGQYINLGSKPGLEFIIDELKSKPDSNRACLSLINMLDIIDSGDDPIPSFMVLQFSFLDGGLKRLQVTAYFRALEVLNFLPINIAEICDIIRGIRSNFPNLEKVVMTIFAFRAYCRSGFSCLTKASIDIATPMEIAIAVEKQDLSKIIEWIDSKLYTTDSVISTSGLDNLSKGLEESTKKYPADLVRYIDETIQTYKEIRDVRKLSSYSTQITNLQNKAHNSLQSAKDILCDELNIEAG